MKVYRAGTRPLASSATRSLLRNLNCWRIVMLLSCWNPPSASSSQTVLQHPGGLWVICCPDRDAAGLQTLVGRLACKSHVRGKGLLPTLISLPPLEVSHGVVTSPQALGNGCPPPLLPGASQHVTKSQLAEEEE